MFLLDRTGVFTWWFGVIWNREVLRLLNDCEKECVENVLRKKGLWFKIIQEYYSSYDCENLNEYRTYNK